MLAMFLLFLLIFAIAISTWDSDFHRHHVHPHIPIHIIRQIPQSVYNRPWAFRSGMQVVFVDRSLTEVTMLRVDDLAIQNFVLIKSQSSEEESRVSWSRVATFEGVEQYSLVYENQIITITNLDTEAVLSMSVTDMDNALFR